MPKHDPKPKGHYGHPKHDSKPAHEHKGHYGKPKHAKGHYGHAKPAKHEHKGHYGALWAACGALLLLQGRPLCMSHLQDDWQLRPCACIMLGMYCI